jgi:hypothetical protein
VELGKVEVKRENKEMRSKAVSDEVLSWKPISFDVPKPSNGVVQPER